MYLKAWKILFAVCMMGYSAYGQKVFIRSAFPVQLNVNERTTDERNTHWVVSKHDSIRQMGVVLDDSVWVAKRTSAKWTGNRLYVLERGADQQWQLFYRTEQVQESQFSDPSGHWQSFTPRPEQWAQIETLPDPDTPRSANTLLLSPPIDEFKLTLESFKSIQYEYERVQAIIKWSNDKNLSTMQIRSLLMLTEYDPSRLQLLRELYPRCIHPDRYDDLSNSLQFEASKQNFKQWLTQTRELD